MFGEDYIAMTFGDFYGLLLGMIFWPTFFLVFFMGVKRVGQAIRKKNG
jgi:hypothetical protein